MQKISSSKLLLREKQKPNFPEFFSQSDILWQKKINNNMQTKI